MRALVLLALVSSLAWPAQRSSVQTRAFQRLSPCPSTGAHRGKCPGYVIDHVYPLCAGGQDDPSNMQWQTIQDAKRKDAWERRLCRSHKPALLSDSPQ